MKFTFKAFEKVINPLFIGLIFLEILIVVIYLGSILQTGKAYPPFDMDGRMTIPSLLQAFHLFLIGFISLILFSFKNRTSRYPSRLLLFVVGCFLIYASLDELFKIHLEFRHWNSGVHTRYWMSAYLFIFVMIPVVFFREFLALFHQHRKETLLVFLGMIIFILGGFGSEIFKHGFLEDFLWKTFRHHHFATMFIEKVRVAFEEFLELLGENSILYGILLFVAQRLEKRLEISQIEHSYNSD